MPWCQKRPPVRKGLSGAWCSLTLAWKARSLWCMLSWVKPGWIGLRSLKPFIAHLGSTWPQSFPPCDTARREDVGALVLKLCYLGWNSPTVFRVLSLFKEHLIKYQMFLGLSAFSFKLGIKGDTSLLRQGLKGWHCASLTLDFGSSQVWDHMHAPTHLRMEPRTSCVLSEHCQLHYTLSPRKAIFNAMFFSW